jgi:hypothetical protein
MIEGVIAESALNKQFTLILSPSEKSSFSTGLTTGQLLEGRVVEALGNHQFLVDFKGIKVVAESMLELTAGQHMQVKIMQTAPRVVMNLVTDGTGEQKALSLLRAQLPSHIDWGELTESLAKVLSKEKLYQLEMVVDKNVLEKVSSSLSSLSLSKDEVGDGAKLKEFIERSGLLYESRLKEALLLNKVMPKQLREILEKDLKGLLLKLSQELEEAAGKMHKSGDVSLRSNVQNLLQMVNSSVEKIELHQLVNYLTSKNDQQLVFQIPIVLPEGIKNAELYVRSGYQKSRKGKGDPHDCHIVFLLTMKSLGDLRIDTQVVKKKMRCTIQVENSTIARFVEENLSELSHRLTSLGYTIEKLVCTVKRNESEKTFPLEGFSLLEMRLVDIVA